MPTKNEQYKQPDWIHAGPNLTYDSLHRSYREYLEFRFRDETDRSKKTKVTPEDIIEHAIEYWLFKPYITREARGFYLAQNGEYPITEGVMFNLWFFREMHKKMCEYSWLENPNSQKEFFKLLGWEKE